MLVKLQASGCSGQRGLLSLFVRRAVLVGKGVGAAFTAVAPKDIGTTLVSWLEFEAGQRGLFSLAVRRTALLSKGVGAVSLLSFQLMFEHFRSTTHYIWLHSVPGNGLSFSWICRHQVLIVKVGEV